MIIWSIAVIGFGALMIGEYIPWLAWGSLLLGIALVVHDVWWHITHKRR